MSEVNTMPPPSLERLAFLAHGDGHHRFVCLEAVDRLRLAGVLDVEVDVHLRLLFLRGRGRRLCLLRWPAPCALLPRPFSAPLPSAAAVLRTSSPCRFSCSGQVVDSSLRRDRRSARRRCSSVALRSPLTATVDVTPSRADLPPNRLYIRPSMPANSTRAFSSARTSARTAVHERTRAWRAVRTDDGQVAHESYGSSLWGAWILLCRARLSIATSARRPQQRHAREAHPVEQEPAKRRPHNRPAPHAMLYSPYPTPNDPTPALVRRLGHVGERRRDHQRDRRRLQHEERDRRP